MLMRSPLSKIRVATWEDAPSLRKLARLAHSENGLFSLDQMKVDTMMARLLDKRGGAIGVIGEINAVEGCVWVVVNEGAWYTSDLCTTDALLFVHPDHRKSWHAVRLMAWLRTYAKHNRLPTMTAVVSPEQTEAKCRLYQRMRLPKVGEVYFIRLGDQHGRPVPVKPIN